MRHALIASMLLLSPMSLAVAQVSVQIGLPSVSIGVNQAAYPEMVPVPGYPVYYAPRGDSNYFFYDDPRPCRPTSDGTRGIGIRTRSSSRNCASRTTATCPGTLR
jgi:hypothetical protein